MIYTHTIITSLERRNNDDDVTGLKTFFVCFDVANVKSFFDKKQLFLKFYILFNVHRQWFLFRLLVLKSHYCWRFHEFQCDGFHHRKYQHFWIKRPFRLLKVM